MTIAIGDRSETFDHVSFVFHKYTSKVKLCFILLIKKQSSIRSQIKRWEISPIAIVLAHLIKVFDKILFDLNMHFFSCFFFKFSQIYIQS